jgi:hypothetical protein
VRRIDTLLAAIGKERDEYVRLADLQLAVGRAAQAATSPEEHQRLAEKMDAVIAEFDRTSARLNALVDLAWAESRLN